jgi:hypothetical protein
LNGDPLSGLNDQAKGLKKSAGTGIRSILCDKTPESGLANTFPKTKPGQGKPTSLKTLDQGRILTFLFHGANQDAEPVSSNTGFTGGLRFALPPFGGNS